MTGVGEGAAPAQDPKFAVRFVAAAGYPTSAPIVVGAHGFHESGGLTADTQVYTGSLSKQLTAACAALLVRQGRLDVDTELARWMPELPDWARTVRVRQLIHHTGGLPGDVHLDETLRGAPARTTDGVVRALCRHGQLDTEPGSAFAYSNAGYVCLGVVVARAAGQALPSVAQEQIFGPLGMGDTSFWSGPSLPPGAAPLDRNHPDPLSLGDGGVWSTARDLLRWNRSLLRDELGISGLMHTVGRLNNGTPLDYAWGVGVRSRHGFTVYRHGGSWPGVTALLAGIPGLDAGFVVVALDDDSERAGELADALLDELVAAT